MIDSLMALGNIENIGTIVAIFPYILQAENEFISMIFYAQKIRQ